MNQSGESPYVRDSITFTSNLGLDLESGKTFRLIDERYAFLMDVTGERNGHWMVADPEQDIVHPDSSNDMTWVITDLKSGREVKRFPYVFHVGQDRIVVANRFLVTMRGDHLECIDTASDTPEPRRFGQDKRVVLIDAYGSSSYFSVLYQGKTTAAIYRVDEGSGELTRVAQWPVSSINARHLTLFSGVHDGLIATLSSDTKSIEIRDMETGSTTRRISLPSEVDFSKTPFQFYENWFGYIVDNQLQLIRCDAQQATATFPTTDEHWSVRGNLLTYHDGASRVICDLNEGTELAKAYTNEVLRAVDRNFGYIVNSKWGWTVEKYDSKSWGLVQRWRPYRYVVPVLAFLVIGFFVWCSLWVRHSTASQLPVYIDLLLIGLPAFALLSFRAWVSGTTVDASRTVYNYAQGIALASAALAMLWLVMGKTRLTLRTLPLIAVSTLITFALAGLFHTHPQTAWDALASVFAPVFCLPVVFWPARVLGFGFRSGHESVEPLSQSGDEFRFPLRDLIILTILISVGFSALRLIAGGVDALANFHLMLTPLLLFLGITVAGASVTLSPIRWLFFTGMVLWFVTLVYLMIDPFCRFIDLDWYLVESRLPSGVVYRVLMTYSVAFVMLLIPIRARGWRMVKRIKSAY